MKYALLFFILLLAGSNVVFAQKHVYGKNPWVEFPGIDYVNNIPTNAYRGYYKLTRASDFILLRKTLERFEKAEHISGNARLSYSCDLAGTKCLYISPPETESPGNYYFKFVVSKEVVSLFIYYNVEVSGGGDVDQKKIIGRADLLSESVIAAILKSWLS